MGRAGIDYSQVAKAALGLLDRGENPTVDGVRAVLGSGSKSTIAPLLKRWKDELTGTANAAGDRLPPDLLDAVRRLYEDTRQRFDEALATTKQEAQSRIEELENAVSTITAQLAQCSALCDARTQELARASDDLASLRRQLDVEQVEREKHALAQALLQQHLEERHADIANLQEQLSLGRQQFEHFQAATQARWERERERSDTQLAEAAHATMLLRDQLSQAQTEVAAANAKFDQLSNAHNQLTAEHAKLQEAAEELRRTSINMEQTIGRYESDLVQSRAMQERVQHTNDTLSEQARASETQLAVSLGRESLLQSNLEAAERRVQELLQEQTVLLRKQAETDVELRYCRQGLDRIDPGHT
ncbi:DNA-binding protein [Massilia sp. 2TAF26]|uniref:DNA-binding protein n=1 Tax=Massilia sp. 2TAF26 TaxID=3233012 RepID=UPI003F9C15CE